MGNIRSRLPDKSMTPEVAARGDAGRRRRHPEPTMTPTRFAAPLLLSVGLLASACGSPKEDAPGTAGKASAVAKADAPPAAAKTNPDAPPGTAAGGATPTEPDAPSPAVAASKTPLRDALVAKILTAAKAKDFAALEGLMDEEFYAFGPADDGDDTKAAALKKWHAHPDQLEKLAAMLSGPCGESEDEWICPKEITELEEYGDSEFVSLQRVDGRWHWHLFIADPEVPVPGAGVSAENRRAAHKEIKRGRALSAKKIDLPEAVKAFERALALDPGSATAACEAGYAELRQGNLEAAQRHLELGLQIPSTDKKEAACRFNLGMVHEEQGETARALREYRKSLALRDKKAVHARIAKLAPGGQCLPPARVLDLSKPACGLPDDYWECDDGPDSALLFVESFADTKPVAAGAELRVAHVAFGETRHRYDLLLDEGGTLSLLAELGWTLATDIDADVDAVEYAHVDLVKGGATEVVITVRSTEDKSMSDAVWFECEGKHNDEGPEFEACVDKAQAAGPQKSTTYFGCGKLEGRWVCGEAADKPSTVKDFEALFECR
ncbi:MAG: hypothetical protein AAF721_06955 [Myxococcota bacterium]